ncbi:hypothetical protein [Dietzia cinnamea]|uniref:hypothetical protein n=1 Tax=Dietzia cinnamea TaxID=321318 RepID=UPI00223B50E7|nr:hypothetical protein [Dietzia cinnamea]MCT2061757.1 hypothetical protein [Dietzia cinnamea]MCT2235680.1 hypothetical protein [Dietzia cinnamea]MCT2300095.1 hypothetical protein [Dietzia cinnamea]
MKTKMVALAATSLLVLAGCATGADAPVAPEAAAPATTEVEVAEHEIVVGETFTMNSPHYVAHVTVTDVFLPDTCGPVPYSDGAEYPTHIGIEMDVEVESGNGEGFVPNGVNERTEDGFIEKNRGIAAVNCEGYEELSATRVQTGEKHRGVLWLQEDVDPSSEIILEPHVSAQEPDVTEVYVLDLSEFDLSGDQEAPETTTQSSSPAAAPANTPAPVGPTFVSCVDAGGMAALSDGSRVYMDRCYENASRPGGDTTQARAWTECVIANGHDYCVGVYAPQFQDAPAPAPAPNNVAPTKAPEVQAEADAGQGWWAECIAANTAEYCRANDPWQN